MFWSISKIFSICKYPFYQLKSHKEQIAPGCLLHTNLLVGGGGIQKNQILKQESITNPERSHI